MRNQVRYYSFEVLTKKNKQGGILQFIEKQQKIFHGLLNSTELTGWVVVIKCFFCLNRRKHKITLYIRFYWIQTIPVIDQSKILGPIIWQKSMAFTSYFRVICWHDVQIEENKQSILSIYIRIPFDSLFVNEKINTLWLLNIMTSKLSSAS